MSFIYLTVMLESTRCPCVSSWSTWLAAISTQCKSNIRARRGNRPSGSNYAAGVDVYPKAWRKASQNGAPWGVLMSYCGRVGSTSGCGNQIIIASRPWAGVGEAPPADAPEASPNSYNFGFYWSIAKNTTPSDSLQFWYQNRQLTLTHPIKNLLH